MFKFDKSRYPNSYDWLTKKQQNQILNWLENEYYLMKSAEETKVDSASMEDVSARCAALESHYKSSLQGAKSILSNLDIYAEYDWPGHEGKFFLATYEDAERYKKEMVERVYDSE